MQIIEIAKVIEEPVATPYPKNLKKATPSTIHSTESTESPTSFMILPTQPTCSSKLLNLISTSEQTVFLSLPSPVRATQITARKIQQDVIEEEVEEEQAWISVLEFNEVA